MKLKNIALLSLSCLATALPLITQAYQRPFVFELLPAGTCTYSACFGISPDGDTAVGVSSSSPIIIGADKEISPSAGQTFVATVWNTSSLPANGPYEVTGTALSALTSYSAALYAVASGGATMVGTRFGTSGTTGFTVTSSSTITNFSSTTNSYGIGLGGAGGANLATGWATNSSLNCPCFYVISPPTGTTGGLYYFSTSAGVASTVSSPTGGSGAVLNL